MRKIIILIIFLMAIVFLFSENKFQGKTAEEWAKVADDNKKLADKNQQYASEWQKMYFNTDEELKTIKNQPSPTPKTVYQTQYVTRSDPSLEMKINNLQQTEDQIRSRQQQYQIWHP